MEGNEWDEKEWRRGRPFQEEREAGKMVCGVCGMFSSAMTCYHCSTKPPCPSCASKDAELTALREREEAEETGGLLKLACRALAERTKKMVELEDAVRRGCQCICHKHPEHFPFELLASMPSIIRGHKSHWQETFDRVQRDELLETVAKHVEAKIAAYEEAP